MEIQDTLQREQSPRGLLLPVGLGQALIDYLVKRPYHEVYTLVHALQSLEPITDTIKEDGRGTINNE